MKRVISFIFTIAIIALLIYILWDINFYEVYVLIAKANPGWFLLAVLAMFLTYVAWNLRWQYIFKPIFKGDFKFFLQVLFAGAFISTVTPGAGIGGEPFRAHYLAKKYKKSRSMMLGYVLGDTFFKIAVFAVFIVFSVFFVLIFVNISDSLKLILELILVGVLIAAGVLLFSILKRFHFKLGVIFKKLYHLRFIRYKFSSEKHFSEYLNTKFRWILTIFRKVVRKKENLYFGLFLSVIFWILHFLVAYFLFLSFGYQVNFLSVIIVVTLAWAIGSLSVVPGGVGVIESGMTLLYSAMGIPVPLAFLVAFSTRIINYFFALFIGGMSLVHLRKLFNGGRFSLF